MPSNTIRVGIVGCGGIAFAKHLPFLSQMDGKRQEKPRSSMVQRMQKSTKIGRTCWKTPALMWCMCLHLTSFMQR